MNTGLRVVTPPCDDLVPMERLRRHMRVDFDEDDDLIKGYGQAACLAAERYTNRAFLQTGYLYTVQPNVRSEHHSHQRGPFRWRHPIELPRSRLISIDSVIIHDIAGNVALLPQAAYVLEGQTDPARLRLDYHSGLINPVAPLLDIQIAFTAGYGTSREAVPTTIIHAILLTASFLYENRGDAAGGEPPKAAQWLLDLDRVNYF